MNTDFRISVTIATHHKTIKLMRRLDDRSFYNLVRLWAYAAANKPDGDLKCMDSEDIEIAADWMGENGLFTKTLVDLRFLNNEDGRYNIHNWSNHNEYAAHAKERSEKAKIAARKKWGIPEGQPESPKKTRAERMRDAREKGNHKDAEWQEMRDFFGTCVKCSGASKLANCDRDHITPVYLGGCHSIRNIQPLCARCNASKGPESVDYRVKFCEDNNLVLPDKWKRNLCQNKECGLLDACLMPAKNCFDHCPSPSPSPSPSLNNYYCKFLLKDNSEYQLTPEQINKFLTTYPDVNFKSEFLKITSWCDNNADKRKTRRGSPRFLNNWFSGAQEKAIANKKPSVQDIVNNQTPIEELIS